MSDKVRLSAKTRQPRSDDDVADAAVRMIRALGRRAATADPDSARLLRMLVDELDQAFALAVAGWRSQGFSDSMIGSELRVTKQAVQQRWPRGSSNSRSCPTGETR